MEYNIRNGPIQWKISTYIKITLEFFFCLLSPFSIYFQIRDLENVDKMYNIRRGAIQWQMTTSYLMTITMFALSLPFTRYSQIKKNAKTLALKMKVKE